MTAPARLIKARGPKRNDASRGPVPPTRPGRRPARILAADAFSWLDQVTCPVRLMTGDRDPIVDRHHLLRFASRQAGVELTEWAGGHNLPLARSEDCMEQIDHVVGGVIKRKELDMLTTLRWARH